MATDLVNLSPSQLEVARQIISYGKANGYSDDVILTVMGDVAKQNKWRSPRIRYTPPAPSRCARDFLAGDGTGIRVVTDLPGGWGSRRLLSSPRGLVKQGTLRLPKAVS